MKQLFLILKALLPHVIFVLSLMMLTFFITDLFNRPMGFLNNDLFRALLCLLSVSAALQAVIAIVQQRK